MKTVIYVLAGAIALSSVGCTAGRKERQPKAEPPSGSKAVAKTRTSARAVLNSSAKPADAKRVGSQAQGSTKTATISTQPAVSGVKKDSKVESRESATKPSVAKVSSKPVSRGESKQGSRSSSGGDSSVLSFNVPSVDAVAPMPKSGAQPSRVVIPPKLVRADSLTESREAVPPSSKENAEKTAEKEGAAMVAKAGTKPSRDQVQAELNQALADAGTDARAVVGSAPKPSEKPSVVEDDAPSTSDTSSVVKSPASMKSTDVGAPTAVVDSKGEVKEASSVSATPSLASTSKETEPTGTSKTGSPEAAVPATVSTPPTTPAVESVAPPKSEMPKKPASPLEKKEMIATALRDGNEALRSEDSTKALELFESVVKQDKDQRDAWFRIGYLKEMSGDIQGAIKAFREVKRILAN